MIVASQPEPPCSSHGMLEVKRASAEYSTYLRIVEVKAGELGSILGHLLRLQQILTTGLLQPDGLQTESSK